MALYVPGWMVQVFPGYPTASYLFFCCSALTVLPCVPAVVSSGLVEISVKVSVDVPGWGTIPDPHILCSAGPLLHHAVATTSLQHAPTIVMCIDTTAWEYGQRVVEETKSNGMDSAVRASEVTISHD